MEENIFSTTLIDISRYCSSLADDDLWSSSQSCSRSPMQRLFPPTPTRSTDSDSPVLPSPPLGWSLSSSFATMNLDPSSSSTSSWSNNNSALQHQSCSCCHCGNKTESWSEKFQNRIRPRSNKDEKQTITPIQRPSPARTSTPSTSLNMFDNDDDGTLRLHVSNIPFTWSKEKLAEVFGKFGTTFDVEVVYNERGSKGFGFVTFLTKKDALEAKKRMDREIVDGRRLVVNFAKPKQKIPISTKENSATTLNWKTNNSNERSQRGSNNHYQSLGFSTPPTARRQHLSGFSSLSSTPTRPTTTNNYHRYYL